MSSLLTLISLMGILILSRSGGSNMQTIESGFSMSRVRYPRTLEAYSNPNFLNPKCLSRKAVIRIADRYLA
jgi:hypothetical protein